MQHPNYVFCWVLLGSLGHRELHRLVACALVSLPSLRVGSLLRQEFNLQNFSNLVWYMQLGRVGRLSDAIANLFHGQRIGYDRLDGHSTMNRGFICIHTH